MHQLQHDIIQNATWCDIVTMLSPVVLSANMHSRKRLKCTWCLGERRAIRHVVHTTTPFLSPDCKQKKTRFNVNKGPTRCSCIYTFIFSQTTQHVSAVTHPSSGVSKTVSATTGTRHSVRYRSKLQCFCCWHYIFMFCVVFSCLLVCTISSVVTIYRLKDFLHWVIKTFTEVYVSSEVAIYKVKRFV